MLDRNQILEAATELDALPAFPEVIRQLEEELKRPLASVARAARIVESDPALATRFLAAANSAFYSRGRKITSIQQATARLGLAEARRIAMATALVGAYRQIELGDQRSFWIHSIAVGLTARVMARMASVSVPEDVLDTAYTVGLVHDLGIAAMHQILGEVYLAMLDDASEAGTPIWEEEQKLFDTDHGEVGEVLARTWELPEAVCAGIRYHHTPWLCTGEHRLLVTLVHLADFVCNNQGLGRLEEASPESFDDGAWDSLGLSLDQVPEIVAAVRAEGERSQAFWGDAS